MRYIVSGDQHAGAFDEVRWYSEVKEILIEEIKNDKELDVVFLAGDWFHKKLSANSKAMKYATKALFEILNICGKRDIKVRMIKGTSSHDNNQLELFGELTDGKMDICDFKIFSQSGYEIIRFGDETAKVLYIPEEYVINQDEYYSELFSHDDYDIIIGHGMIDKAAFISNSIETEHPRADAPIFKVEDLIKICNGPIYFGHIHKRMTYKSFKYTGSLSVWGFGEEEEKGFIKGSMNLSSKVFKDKYIDNILRLRFNTWRYETDDALFNNSPNMLITALLHDVNNEFKYELSDRLRLIVNIPVDYPHAIVLTKLLNEVFTHNVNVKLDVRNTSANIEKDKVEQDVHDLINKYPMLFDSSLTDAQKFSQYIKVTEGVNIDIEFIENAIKKD